MNKTYGGTSNKRVMKVNGGATEAMKPLLGNYYQYDETPILKAMNREMKECIYVEKDEGETKGVY